MLAPAPKNVRENIARAKAYLRREDLPRAMEAMGTALRAYAGTKLIGQARFETEVNVLEFVNDLNRHHLLRQFFEARQVFNGPYVTYARGEENTLAERLETIGAAMTEESTRKEREREAKVGMRREELILGGQAKLDEGDMPRGRSFLKRAADEFGHEPGVLADIGQRLLHKELLFEAAEMFEAAIETFPTESKAYAGSVSCYIKLQEYEKAETIYMKALRQFGAHPRTLINIARLYMLWRKRDKAYEYAKRALGIDPKLKEAQEIMEAASGRT